jgi:hypothetical protein
MKSRGRELRCLRVVYCIIASVLLIRIYFVQLDPVPDPDPGGQKRPTKRRKKLKNSGSFARQRGLGINTIKLKFLI